MIRSFLAGIVLAATPLLTAVAQQAPSTSPAATATKAEPAADEWGVAPAATTAPETPAVTEAPIESEATPSPTASGPGAEGAPAPSMTAMPKLNPNSETSSYAAKEVKKSREQAAKVAEKAQRRTIRNRTVMQRERENSIHKMRRAKGR